MKLGIVIIDDEKNAIEALESAIKLSNTNFDILATSTSALEGIGLILKHKPELVFLDIEMPELNGFELLDSIPDINFEVVFATAYEQYAIKAIKNNAADYILKPVSVKDVKASLQKVEEKFLKNASPNFNYESLIAGLKNNGSEKIKINTCGGFELIEVDRIINIEAHGAYSYAYFSEGGKIIITKPLKELEKQINSTRFFRMHRSHLINIDYVQRYESDKNVVVLSDGRKVPLARRRIEQFKILLDEILT